MKKGIIILSLLVYLNSFGQTLQDAINLSFNTNQIGSARFNSLGGAMGALGQDISSCNINPASGAIVKDYSIFGISFNNLYISNQNSFYDANNRSNSNTFNVNQVGFISSFFDEKGNKGISFHFNYNIFKNLNQRITVNNSTTDNSIIQSFVNNANYFDYLGNGEIDEVEGLAEDLGIIKFDFNRPNNEKYYTDITNFDNIKSIDMINRGSIGEYTFGGSFNFGDIIFVGLSGVYRSINLDKEVNLNENFTMYNSTLSPDNRLSYQQYVNTNGNGLGISLGAILKPTYFFRLGISYKSDINYELKDVYSYKLEGQVDDIYEYTYNFRDPSKITFSGAFIFGQIGLLSIDVENINYSKMKFYTSVGTQGDDFADINDEISYYIENTTNIRLGTEWRWLIFRARAGYNYIPSPLKKISINDYYKSSAANLFSFGLGAVINKFDIDISYSFLMQEYSTYIYDVTLVNAIETNNIQNSVTISLSYYLL